MAISELQIALFGAGAAAVALVWGYNAWQDNKHRKTADRIFKGGQGDALLDGEQADEAPVSTVRTEPAERQEPCFSEPLIETPEPLAQADSTEPEAMPEEVLKPMEPALAVAEPMPAPGSAAAPSLALPIECADGVADCVLHLNASEALSAPVVLAIHNAWSGGLSKSLRWAAQSDDAWRPISAGDGGSYRSWVVALQLVDRRGAVADAELAHFFDGVQHLAQQTGAALELPSRSEVLIHAAKLDEFCAGVDIQFVLHVVDASGGVFAGTKLRGVAEAAGLALEADGVFRARDAVGGELFSVASLGAERLDADSIKSLTTHGLTLSLDVPRVAEGAQAFDRMLAAARQLATGLGGVLVDAQRAPLADAMIKAIRAKTIELQQTMRDGGIIPGSSRALRLFS